MSLSVDRTQYLSLAFLEHEVLADVFLVHENIKKTKLRLFEAVFRSFQKSSNILFLFVNNIMVEISEIKVFQKLGFFEKWFERKSIEAVL